MELKLPPCISSRQDLNRVYRELGNFIDVITQSLLRGDKSIKYPPITDNLRSLAVDNKIDLRDEKACEVLLSKLEYLKSNSPSVRISFAVEPSPDALQKLIVWFRKNVDPRLVIQIGIQPSIAAGIILKTPNKQFDFSLRQHLYANKQKFVDALGTKAQS